MRILVTNDDGVDAVGLAAIVEGLTVLDHEIIVVAPIEDCSGAGGAIGPIQIPHHFDLERRALHFAPGVEAYGVGAYPAMCVLAAMLGCFGKPPEIVISGINAGPNIGRTVFHSGTVAAALTGAMHGARAMAVSLGSVQGTHWDTAVTVALGSLEWLLLDHSAPVININVPDRPPGSLRGFRRAVLAPLGQLRTSMIDSDGALKLELTLHQGIDPEGSDAAFLRQGFVTISALRGVDVADGDHADDLVRTLNG